MLVSVAPPLALDDAVDHSTVGGHSDGPLPAIPGGGSESPLTHFASSGGEHPVETAGCADQLLRTPAEPAGIATAIMCSGPIVDRVLQQQSNGAASVGGVSLSTAAGPEDATDASVDKTDAENDASESTTSDVHSGTFGFGDGAPAQSADENTRNGAMLAPAGDGAASSVTVTGQPAAAPENERRASIVKSNAGSCCVQYPMLTKFAPKAGVFYGDFATDVLNVFELWNSPVQGALMAAYVCIGVLAIFPTVLTGVDIYMRDSGGMGYLGFLLNFTNTRLLYIGLGGVCCGTQDRNDAAEAAARAGSDLKLLEAVLESMPQLFVACTLLVTGIIDFNDKFALFVGILSIAFSAISATWAVTTKLLALFGEPYNIFHIVAMALFFLADCLLRAISLGVIFELCPPEYKIYIGGPVAGIIIADVVVQGIGNLYYSEEKSCAVSGVAAAMSLFSSFPLSTKTRDRKRLFYVSSFWTLLIVAYAVTNGFTTFESPETLADIQDPFIESKNDTRRAIIFLRLPRMNHTTTPVTTSAEETLLAGTASVPTKWPSAVQQLVVGPALVPNDGQFGSVAGPQALPGKPPMHDRGDMRFDIMTVTDSDPMTPKGDQLLDTDVEASQLAASVTSSMPTSALEAALAAALENATSSLNTGVHAAIENTTDMSVTRSRTRRCYSTEGSARDNGGDSCSWYSRYSSSCGDYDDSNFRAYSMCCACGGGSRTSSSCSSHSSCSSSTYCDSARNCYSCSACSTYNDAYNGYCPSKCYGSSNSGSYSSDRSGDSYNSGNGYSSVSSSIDDDDDTVYTDPVPGFDLIQLGWICGCLWLLKFITYYLAINWLEAGDMSTDASGFEIFAISTSDGAQQKALNPRDWVQRLMDTKKYEEKWNKKINFGHATDMKAAKKDRSTARNIIKALALAQSDAATESLHLLNTKIGKMTTKANDEGPLGRAFAAANSVRDVDLTGNTLKDEGFVIVCKPIAKHRALEWLDLSDNEVGAEGGLAAAAMIENTVGLTRVTLNKNLFGSALPEMMAALGRNQTILEFHFEAVTESSDQVPLGSSAGSMLKANTTLHLLCLSRNKLPAQAFEPLMQGLDNTLNKTLKMIYLNTCSFGDTGARMLSVMLTKNHTLTTIQVRNNDMDDAGGQEIAESLSKNKGLEVSPPMAGILPDFSSLSRACARALALALHISPSLPPSRSHVRTHARARARTPV